jgi:arylsulfatase
MLKAYEAWRDDVRPQMVHEDASLDTGKPFQEQLAKQKEEKGIPQWKPQIDD